MRLKYSTDCTRQLKHNSTQLSQSNSTSFVKCLHILKQIIRSKPNKQTHTHTHKTKTETKYQKPIQEAHPSSFGLQGVVQAGSQLQGLEGLRQRSSAWRGDVSARSGGRVVEKRRRPPRFAGSRLEVWRWRWGFKENPPNKLGLQGSLVWRWFGGGGGLGLSFLREPLFGCKGKPQGQLPKTWAVPKMAQRFLAKTTKKGVASEKDAQIWGTQHGFLFLVADNAASS